MASPLRWRDLKDPQAAIIAALIAAIPALIAAIAGFNAGKSSGSGTTVPNVSTMPSITLDALFGANSEPGRSTAPKVEMLSQRDNIQRISDRFALAEKRIRIVTLTGSSWISSTHLRRFEQAIKRVQVEVLMLDFKDKDLYEVVQEAVKPEMLNESQYVRHLQSYANH